MTVQELLEEARKLPEPERERLLALLEAEVTPTAEQLSEAWLTEIDRRITAARDGRDPGTPWEDVRRRLRERFPALT